MTSPDFPKAVIELGQIGPNSNRTLAALMSDVSIADGVDGVCSQLSRFAADFRSHLLQGKEPNIEVTTIRLDLGEDGFRGHVIIADGTVVFNRSIRRRQLLKFSETLPSCLVGVEACGSAHNGRVPAEHWCSGDLTTATSGRTRLSQTKIPTEVNRAGHLSNLRAPRPARLPKITTTNMKTRTADSRFE